MDSNNCDAQTNVEKALIEMAVESWRFSRGYVRLISKLDAGESTRFVNQYRYFTKRLEESLAAANLKLANVEGHPYDPGTGNDDLRFDRPGDSSKDLLKRLAWSYGAKP